MKPYREIEFTTTRIKGDLAEGKTCYQGHLQHNAVLSEKETKRGFADYCGEPEGIGPMGVTVFDCSKNERHPTAWHIRAYGLFAANNLYFKGGFDIPAGTSVTYRFRILFRRRAMEHRELSDRYVMYTLNPLI